MLRPEDCIPGTLVECIDASPGGWGNPVPFIRERGVYTIDGIDGGVGPSGDWVVGVLLRGYNGFDCFCLRRFRLLPDERLSIFRAMLAPAPQKERV